jgi:hypothetical protein
MDMKHHLLFLLAAFACIRADAQFYNNGTLFVNTGGTLYVNTPFTNDIGGGWQNNGTTYLGGNVTNNQASMTPGSGTTVFNGTTPQTISGSAPYRAFNVTLNNTAGLILSDRLAIGDGIGGTLAFAAGAITSPVSTQDVYFYPGSSYSGYSATNHVIGFVTKSGTDDFDFPIGDGSHKADISMSGLSGTADFQALYTGTGFGTNAVTPPLVPNGVFQQEWWDLEQVAGASSAHVSLKWNDARKTLNHTNPGSLVVAHFTGGIWTSAGGSSTDPAGSSTGTVGPSNTLSSFSPFTFGSTATPLPITLGTFSVDDVNCQAYLTWNTTLELNAASFDIQQSADAVNFATVGNVRADDTAATYHTTVAQQTRQAFYRLRMVDLDGTATYSGIDALTLSCLPQAQRLSIYPNPLTASINLTAHLYTPDAKGQAQIQVIDGTGRRVYTMPVTVNSGDNLYSLPTSGLAQGIYNIVVLGDGWRSDVISFSKAAN